MTLAEEIERLAARYPERRSAILPALRLAQERYGWLPPEALLEVGEALGLTPAYCLSVASFYDMLHLQPVGRHLIEVCTNICCGLKGAEEVLDPAQKGCVERIREWSGGHGVSAAVDCAGVPASQRLCIEAAGPRGRVAFVGE